MALAQSITAVEIDGESYSILDRPKSQSAVVKAEGQKLAAYLTLDTLSYHLKSVARFIRVTYYATGAAPAVKEVQDLRIDISKLGRNVSTLCDESYITVANFKSTSSDILLELESAYGYLMDGLEDMAMETLSELSGEAEEMVKAAEDMKKKFEAEAEKVNAIVEKTIKSKNKYDEQEKKKREEQAELQKKIENEEKMMKTYSEREKEAKKEKKEHLEKVLDVIGKMDNSFFGSLKRKFVGDTANNKIDEYDRERREAMKREIENREKHLESMKKQNSLLQEMAKCDFEKIEYQKVVDLLHQAITALRGLAVFMDKAARFWRQMQDHCKKLAEKGLQKEFKKIMAKETEEERKKYWTGRGFQIKAVQYYAKWVALYNVCEHHMLQIRDTQKEIDVYITENPTREQCRKKLASLCEGFEEDTNRAEKETKQFTSDAMKQIEDNKSENVDPKDTEEPQAKKIKLDS